MVSVDDTSVEVPGVIKDVVSDMVGVSLEATDVTEIHHGPVTNLLDV